jgi:hypothetical protein
LVVEISALYLRKTGLPGGLQENTGNREKTDNPAGFFYLIIR